MADIEVSSEQSGTTFEFEVSMLPNVIIEIITSAAQLLDDMGLSVVDGAVCQTYIEED